MPKADIDYENLRVTGAHKTATGSNVVVRDEKEEIVVIVTQAFGPDGESLVGVSDVKFDGYPALTLLVKANGKEGLVHLSPFHGDRRKSGFLDVAVGTKCELYSPTTGKRLPHLGPVGDGSQADWYGIYLTPRLSDGEMVAISDVWGDYHSRIVDNFELISEWAARDGND